MQEFIYKSLGHFQHREAHFNTRELSLDSHRPENPRNDELFICTSHKLGIILHDTKQLIFRVVFFFYNFFI